MWSAFLLERSIFRTWSSMWDLLFVIEAGICVSVNIMSCLMKVRSPPPLSCVRSFRIVEYPGIIGVLLFAVSLDSCMVAIVILFANMRSLNSSDLFVMALILHWSIFILVIFLFSFVLLELSCGVAEVCL